MLGDLMSDKPKLETYIRKIKQPSEGFIPLTSLHIDYFNESPLSSNTGFSKMLLSSVIQHITAFGTCGYQTMINRQHQKIMDRIHNMPEDIQKKEMERVSKWISIFQTTDQIDRKFIEALCEFLTYAPVNSGGSRKYPDGGYITPTQSDIKTIWKLAKRSYAFLYNEHARRIDFKVRYAAGYEHFSSATIDFITDSAVYKIATLTTPPQSRDLLLVVAWALIAGVDRYGIYNPCWDVLYWGRVSDLPKEARNTIKKMILKPDKG